MSKSDIQPISTGKFLQSNNISTNLVAVSANSHEKVVRLNITMDEVFVVYIFNTANHLHITCTNQQH